MPQGRDLVRRIRDVGEETLRQAESLRARADQKEADAIEGNAPTPSIVREMRFNAADRKLDGEFLRDLADSIDRHGDGAALIDEIARDAL